MIHFGLNIGARHISISTCGIADKIRELAKLKFSCTLSVSLHYTDDETRSKIMPVNRKYNIEELLSACKYYEEETGKRISFEYALIKGLNDSIEDAERLVGLIRNIKSHVNLIPINEIEERTFKKTSNENVIKFRDYLNDHGIVATVRRKLRRRYRCSMSDNLERKILIKYNKYIII